MTPDQQFVSTTSILTFGGASVGVLMIAATIQKVISKTWIAIPFAASLLVGTIVAAYSKNFHSHSPLDWLVAFINCCLLFCTATGANELAAVRPAGGLKLQSKLGGKWFVSWLT